MKRHEPRLLAFAGFPLCLEAGSEPQEAPTICGCDIALVTVLEDVRDDSAVLDNRVTKSSWSLWDWHPAFWDRPQVVLSTLRLLHRGIANPTYYVIGEYLAEELEKLESLGKIDPALKIAIRSKRIRSNLPVIVQFDSAEEIMFPFHQGYGHFPGVRVAIYDRSDQPFSICNQWASDHLDSATSPLDDWLGRDLMCLGRPLAWMGPFGAENRQHCTLWRRGRSADSLVSDLAHELELQKVTTSASRDQFNLWEWDYTLPSDI